MFLVRYLKNKRRVAKSRDNPTCNVERFGYCVECQLRCSLRRGMCYYSLAAWISKSVATQRMLEANRAHSRGHSRSPIVSSVVVVRIVCENYRLSPDQAFVSYFLEYETIPYVLSFFF